MEMITEDTSTNNDFEDFINREACKKHNFKNCYLCDDLNCCYNKNIELKKLNEAAN